VTCVRAAGPRPRAAPRGPSPLRGCVSARRDALQSGSKSPAAGPASRPRRRAPRASGIRSRSSR
jgi:hypothetical protein